MHPYAVFLVDGRQPWLHSVYDDLHTAARELAQLSCLRPAALVEVGGPSLTVLAAGGVSTETLRQDRHFLDAARKAVGA